MTVRISVAVIGRRSFARNRIRSEDLASENLDLLAACDVDPDDAKHGCNDLRSAAMVYRSGKFANSRTVHASQRGFCTNISTLG
jgi:hypothetical protein